jgi:hypothetical protein
VAGGLYSYEPLLVANGFDVRPQLHPRQDAVFETPSLPAGILFHALLTAHLLPLAELLSSATAHRHPPPPSHAVLLQALRRVIDATLAECAAHERSLAAEHVPTFRAHLAEARHALLEAPTVRVKGLLRMRAAGTKNEAFCDACHPLSSSAHPGSDPHARPPPGLGAINRFPQVAALCEQRQRCARALGPHDGRSTQRFLFHSIGIGWCAALLLAAMAGVRLSLRAYDGHPIH